LEGGVQRAGAQAELLFPLASACAGEKREPGGIHPQNKEDNEESRFSSCENKITDLNYFNRT
jgi:hypothetical protein